MELTNKRLQYTVINTGETMELQGELNINEQNNEFSINGFIMALPSKEYINNFYYAQKADGKIDKSLTNMQKDKEFLTADFFNDTIDELRRTLNFD